MWAGPVYAHSVWQLSCFLLKVHLVLYCVKFCTSCVFWTPLLYKCLEFAARALEFFFFLDVSGQNIVKWLKVLMTHFLQYVLSLSFWHSSVQHTKRTKINTLEEWLEGLYLLRWMIWLRELFISRKLWPVLVSTEDRNNSFSLSLLILEAAVMQFLTFST